MTFYGEHLGIGPFEIENPEPFFETMDVTGGRGLKIRTATYREGDCEIELVMPTGEGLYADWLKAHGPGLHHIKFDTDNTYEEVVGEAEKLSGRPPYLEIKTPDGNPIVAYADLIEEAGLLVEIDTELPEE